MVADDKAKRRSFVLENNFLKPKSAFACESRFQTPNRMKVGFGCLHNVAMTIVNNYRKKLKLIRRLGNVRRFCFTIVVKLLTMAESVKISKRETTEKKFFHLPRHCYFYRKNGNDFHDVKRKIFCFNFALKIF